jgi:ABC-2 type transport system ATP-binding protein
VCEIAIRTVGLTRTFGPVVALDDLNLCVPLGAFHGLIGPNGAGKSTTLRLLLGLLCPSAGSCEVFGRDPVTCGQYVRSRVGAVVQPCGLYDALTPLENLDYYGRIWRISAHDRIAHAKVLLTQMGLWERRENNIAEWGPGLRQRLCIARCLMHRPSLIVLDEPFAGLDATAEDSLSRFLVDLVTKSGITILMATNNLPVVEAICHTVTVLSRGRTIASGPTEVLCAQRGNPNIEIHGRGISDEVVTLLLRRPEVTSAYRVDGGVSLQLVGHIDTSPIVSLMIESGVAVCEVRRSEPSLKSAVMSLLTSDANMYVHTADDNDT